MRFYIESVVEAVIHQDEGPDDDDENVERGLEEGLEEEGEQGEGGGYEEEEEGEEGDEEEGEAGEEGDEQEEIREIHSLFDNHWGRPEVNEEEDNEYEWTNDDETEELQDSEQFSMGCNLSHSGTEDLLQQQYDNNDRAERTIDVWVIET